MTPSIRLIVALAISLSAVPVVYSDTPRVASFRHCFVDPPTAGHNRDQENGAFDVLKTYQVSTEPAEFSYVLENNGAVHSVTASSADALTEARTIYYCEQSIWEAAPFAPFEKVSGDMHLRFLIFFKGSRVKAETQTTSESLRIHVIPAAVLRLYPGKFQLEEITGEQNQRTFDVKYCKSQTLSKYRSEWQQFFLKHPRAFRREIFKKAKELEAKFLQPLQNELDLSAK